MMSITIDPFAATRHAIRDLVSIPVTRYLEARTTTRRNAMFTRLLATPLDLAAAGFEVAVTQTDRGWCIAITKELAPNVTLRLCGHATSYVAALRQITNQADAAIGRLERQARETVASEGAAA